MVKKLPVPYMLNVEGEIPNTYLVGLGAGYVASLIGDTLIRDANAFQSFVSQFYNKTGLEFAKGLFGHEAFRRVFILTLANMYSAYASARSQYLSTNTTIYDYEIPEYTTYDDFLLLGEFTINNVKEISELEKILENNKNINAAMRSHIYKKILRLPLNKEEKIKEETEKQQKENHSNQGQE